MRVVTAMKRGLVAFVILLLAGMGVYSWLMVTAATQLRQTAGDASVERSLAGLTFLTIKRVGDVSSLMPGPGFGLVVLAVPALAGLVVFGLALRGARRA